MSDQEHDPREIDGRDSGGPHAGPSAHAGIGRRRFITGAAAGSIVAATVVGRPAWASACSHSGRMSGNLSAQNSEPCGGEGLSPGYWKTHFHEWHEEWPPWMSFYQAFRVDAFPGKTLGDVIWGRTGLSAVTTGEESKEFQHRMNILTMLGVHSVAALQNAATPVSFMLTVPEVVDSFARAYLSGDPDTMELTKDSFDRLNNMSA